MCLEATTQSHSTLCHPYHTVSTPHTQGRARVEGDWALYRGQRGQNLVYANAVYRGLPRSDKWEKGACMTRDFRHDLFTIEK